MTASSARQPEWVKDHIDRYRASGGADGHIWNGVPTLLLTVTGRESGEEFTTPLIYGQSKGRYLIVASRGGSMVHPQWYRNLRANPAVSLQVGAERFSALARTATPEEKAELWPIMTAIWPKYDEYQQATERDIPLVVLERQ